MENTVEYYFNLCSSLNSYPCIHFDTLAYWWNAIMFTFYGWQRAFKSPQTHDPSRSLCQFENQLHSFQGAHGAPPKLQEINIPDTILWLLTNSTSIMSGRLWKKILILRMFPWPTLKPVSSLGYWVVSTAGAAFQCATVGPDALNIEHSVLHRNFHNIFHLSHTFCHLSI